jgi:hypothetical protein
MTVSYTNLRANEGTAIGTIVAYAGSPGTIPAGWLVCNGRTYSQGVYSDLFEVIGNQYDYGTSTTGVFKVPNISGSVMDIATNMQNNLPSGNIPSNYISKINNTNDVGNDAINEGASCNFDLRAEIIPTDNTKFSGTFEGQSINDPSYSEVVTTVGRVLGDHHMASHNHSGTYKTITQKGSNSRGGLCNSYGTDPATDSPTRSCFALSYYAIEANGNARFFASSFSRVASRGGSGWGVNFQAGGANNYATGQMATLNSPVRNFIESSDDVIESDQSRNTGVSKSMTSSASPNDPGSTGGALFGYPVTLNSESLNFVGNALAHAHDATPFEIKRGSMTAPNIINTNNIQLGDVKPLNESLNEMASVTFPSRETSSCNLIYIIRAY